MRAERWALALVVALTAGAAPAHARCGSGGEARCVPPLVVLYEDGVRVPFSDGSTLAETPARDADVDEAPPSMLLTHAEIRSYMRSAAIPMRICAARAEEARSTASGDVTLSWIIKRGVVDSVRVNADTTGIEGVADCIVEKLEGARMPRHEVAFVRSYVWRLARVER